jgi:tripartite-type tricarboxylate transporter receptor subunit TctC
MNDDPAKDLVPIAPIEKGPLILMVPNDSPFHSFEDIISAAKQLDELVNKALTDPTIREQMLGQGNELGGGTPEQFAAFIKTEADRWSKLVKANDIKPE